MSKLLINEVPLMCLPSLAVKIGLNEALFIQQLHYWVDRSKNIIDGRQWVYNTMADWSKQFPFWSQKTLSRTISNLEKQGLVLSGNYNQKGYDRTKWYTIDYPSLEWLEKGQPETRNREEAELDELGENGDQAIGTNCLHEENQGFQDDRGDGAVGDQFIGTKCPYEENQGFQDAVGDDAVGDQFIRTKCLHEENQVFPDTMGDALVGDQAMGTNCPYEEIQGLPDSLSKNSLNKRVIGTSCPCPSGHFVPMESDNLSSPIPENNNRDFSEKTTTNRPAEIVGESTKMEKEAVAQLLLVLPQYGVALATAKRFIAEYGARAVEQQLELLEKGLLKGNINNPAGWLHTALREGYVDATTAFQKLQEGKKISRREKAAEIERQQVAALEREREAELGQVEISKNSPFYGFLERMKKEQSANGTA